MFRYKLSEMIGSVSLLVFCTALCVVAILYGPYINIWCFNTLFKAGIEYNWSTWAAMLWFNVCILGSLSTRRKPS